MVKVAQRSTAPLLGKLLPTRAQPRRCHATPSMKVHAATKNGCSVSECLLSLGVDREHAAQLTAANQDLATLNSEDLTQRLSLLNSLQLPLDVILRTPGVTIKQPNEFWPLLDPKNQVVDLVAFLKGIGAQESDISNTMFKCPQICTVSVMHMSNCILNLRSLGMPIRDIVYCLAQAPLLFTWDLNYFDRAVKVFIPTVALPKSPQVLCLAFGVCFQETLIPARRTQFCVSVVLDLCAAIGLQAADSFNIAWVFRSWLGDFSGMNIPVAYRPKHWPVMTAEALCSEEDAVRMVELLEKHMEECQRQSDEGRKLVRAVVLELEMPKLLLFNPSIALVTVERVIQDGRTVKGL